MNYKLSILLFLLTILIDVKSYDAIPICARSKSINCINLKDIYLYDTEECKTYNTCSDNISSGCIVSNCSTCYLVVKKNYLINDYLVNNQLGIFVDNKQNDVGLTTVCLESDIIVTPPSNNINCYDFNVFDFTSFRHNLSYWDTYQIYFSIYECSDFGNASNEKGKWFVVEGMPKLLNISPMLKSLNVKLNTNKLYKIKLAETNVAGNWEQKEKYLLVIASNLNESEFNTNTHIAKNNITISNYSLLSGSKSLNIAGSTINILPNTTIAYGSNFECKINSNITTSCNSKSAIETDSATTINTINNTSVEKNINITQPTLYPNPTTGNLTITQPTNKANMQIINMYGVVVQSQLLTGTTNQINISHLASGVYTVKLVSVGEVWQTQVVKN